MKLLLDENLSPRLVAALATEFPGSAHVHELSLGSADDGSIWSYARDNDFTIASKDSDFADLSVLRGAPPKLVWIRRGNCSTTELLLLLRLHSKSIDAFLTDELARLYVVD